MTVEVGAGAHRTLAVDGRGQVVGVYRHAAHLRLPAGMVAVVTPQVGRGPLHVRGPVRPELLAPGDRVDVVGGASLRVATAVEVDLAAARVWRGALPEPSTLAGADLNVFAAAPPSALVDPVHADRLAVAVHRLDHDDLAGAARAIGGLGPGLTPSGDDVLAGILLVRRALRGPAAESGLVAVARAVRTTSLSREVLVWAARGQAVEPVHDLLGSVAAGDRAAADTALAHVVALGHSSGADLALGLALGLGLRLGVARTGYR